VHPPASKADQIVVGEDLIGTARGLIGTARGLIGTARDPNAVGDQSAEADRAAPVLNVVAAAPNEQADQDETVAPRSARGVAVFQFGLAVLIHHCAPVAPDDPSVRADLFPKAEMDDPLLAAQQSAA
jgi:hypothetical protein